jgi:probable HAF family extracellular repeat protein
VKKRFSWVLGASAVWCVACGQDKPGTDGPMDARDGGGEPDVMTTEDRLAQPADVADAPETPGGNEDASAEVGGEAPADANSTVVAGHHALNGAGQIVGTTVDASGNEHGFIWQLGTMRDLGTLGGSTSNALSINDAGRVIGNSPNAAGSARAFFADPGLCTLSAEP